MKNKQHHLKGGFARVRLYLTVEQIFTAHLNCDPDRGCRQMLDARRGLYLLDQVYELMYQIAKK